MPEELKERLPTGTLVLGGIGGVVGGRTLLALESPPPGHVAERWEPLRANSTFKVLPPIRVESISNCDLYSFVSRLRGCYLTSAH
jgi:hypothetical protein